MVFANRLRGLGVSARRSMLGMMIAVAATCPVQAAEPMTGAEKLHRLDIMLKVSGARCAAGPDDMRADYAMFARNHRFALAHAAREVQAGLQERVGSGAAAQAYEHLNYALADEYRRGHPWLSCQKLKVAAHGLAMVEGSATLVEAADQILPEAASRHLAMRRD